MIGWRFAPLTIISNEDTDIDSMMTTFNTAVIATASEILGKHHQKKKPWITAEILDLCDTTEDFATSFLHFSLFSTALWDLPNSRPVHSLMLSSHLFLCLPCLLPPFIVPCKMVLARPDEWET